MTEKNIVEIAIAGIGRVLLTGEIGHVLPTGETEGVEEIEMTTVSADDEAEHQRRKTVLNALSFLYRKKLPKELPEIAKPTWISMWRVTEIMPNCQQGTKKLWEKLSKQLIDHVLSRAVESSSYFSFLDISPLFVQQLSYSQICLSR